MKTPRRPATCWHCEGRHYTAYCPIYFLGRKNVCSACGDFGHNSQSCEVERLSRLRAARELAR